MDLIDDHIYQEIHLAPATIDEINKKTEISKALPRSGDPEYSLVKDGEDPWVICHEGSFYYCTVDRQKQKIMVSKFTELEKMADAPLQQVWPAGDGQTPDYLEIWSPELQFLDGKFYIYFALFNGQNSKERIYVLEGGNDPLGDYILKRRLEIPTDRWAIDCSVLVTPTNEKYFIWSGWEEFTNTSQNIYIAKMSNPYTLESDRVCISKPEFEWEKQGIPHVNEGPQALIRNGKIFIIYSASGSWTDDYCLGQLEYVGGDFLDPNSWVKKPTPVFSKTDTIFGPGHASFVSYKGQDYIIYHAARNQNSGWARQVRYKPFTWNEDGSPNFGEPM